MTAATQPPPRPRPEVCIRCGKGDRLAPHCPPSPHRVPGSCSWVTCQRCRHTTGLVGGEPASPNSIT